MNLALALYAVVAGSFLMQTLEEGRRKQLPWDRYHVMGVVLSLAWAVPAVVVAIAVIRGAPWKRGAK